MTPEEVLTRFKRLFRGRENAHGRYTPLDHDPWKDADTYKGPPPEEMWPNHLAGVHPFLGIVPLTLDNTCYFAAIDYDYDQVDHLKLESKVREFNLPLVVCRSKSGGAHLFLFLSEPVSAGTVIDKMKLWMKALGIEKNPPNDKGYERPTEVFPKSSRMKPSDQGNWINLPYFGGDESNRFAIHKGKKLSLEQFLLHAENTRVSEAMLLATRDTVADPFADGPPCLQTLHRDSGWSEGFRNNSLYNIALMYKLSHPDSWQEMANEFQLKYFDPPLPKSEVELLFKSIGDRGTYVYKCSDMPISDFCEKAKCYKRKWGIKAFARVENESNFPELSDLVKVLTDPPLWSVKVGGFAIELTTEDMLSLQRFRKVCLDKLSIVVPILPQPSWDAKLRKILAKHTVQDAPEDAGTKGRFDTLVVEFMRLRKSTQKLGHVKLGKPYEDEKQKVVYFRSSDFHEFLQRKGFREYTPNKIYTCLREMGVTSDKMSVDGEKINLWSMPLTELHAMEEFLPATSDKPTF